MGVINMQSDVIELSGVRKAAILLMKLDVESARNVLKLMSNKEVQMISKEMSIMGAIENEVINSIIDEVWEAVDDGDKLIGNINSTERFLNDVLGNDSVKGIINNITGPKGGTIWEKLSSIDEEKIFLI